MRQKAIPERLRRSAQTRASYIETFTSASGNEVLIDLMKRFHVMSSAFDVEESLARHSEGERNVVLHIMEMVSLTPEQLLTRYNAVRDEQEELRNE